jgi:ABC-2 type transport system permease protein
VIYNFCGIMSFLGLLMVTAFVNGTAVRDFANDTQQIVFSTPIKKHHYLIGKFLGSTFIALIPMLGINIGIIAGSWWPTIDPVRLGPTLLSAHVSAFTMITLPNVLFTSAVIFAVAILMRSSIASFISGIVLLVGYLISQSLMSGLENEITGAMLDPFGSNALDQVTKYWTVSEKNSLMLPTSGVLLWNRLLWIAVSIGIFMFGYLRFSFHDRKQKAKVIVEERVQTAQPTVALPVVARTYTAGDRWNQLRDQIGMDLKRIVTGGVFIITMLLGLAQMITSLSFVTSMYDNVTYPVTYNVADMLSGSLFIFIIIIVTYYAGDLIWKDREARMNDIKDALPTPSWLPLVGNFATMLVLLLVVLFIATLAGIITQALNGYTHFELDVYLLYFIVPAMLGFGFFTMLALFVHTLSPNKYLGYFAFILVIVLNLFLWSGIDVESNLVKLNGSPGIRFSDMARFGPFVKGWIFFRVYWWVFGAMLLFTAFLFAVRGRESGAGWRTTTPKC